MDTAAWGAELATALAESEEPLVEVLVDMEEEGIRLDPAVLLDYGRELDRELASLERQIGAVCRRIAVKIAEGELSQAETDMLLPYLCKAERACCDWHRADMPAVLRDMMGREAYLGL